VPSERARYTLAGHARLKLVGAGAAAIALVAVAGALAVTRSNTITAFAGTGETALSAKTFGDPDFTVSATASTGLPVAFSAGGNCTVSGKTVHITGAGSCTITASQPGDVNNPPAPTVSRTFAISEGRQTIIFARLSNKWLGDPDFTVSARASSGLPVVFAAVGRCALIGTRVHLTGIGLCTIIASQPGDANFAAAAPVARTFAIARRVQPLRCRVPRVISTQLATARSLISNARCRTGTVTRVYSRTKRRGVVIGQSRRPGQVLPVNTKVDLVVSRGRRG
jgi:PASTA domain-containing protein